MSRSDELFCYPFCAGNTTTYVEANEQEKEMVLV